MLQTLCYCSFSRAYDGSGFANLELIMQSQMKFDYHAPKPPTRHLQLLEGPHCKEADGCGLEHVLICGTHHDNSPNEPLLPSLFQQRNPPPAQRHSRRSYYLELIVAPKCPLLKSPHPSKGTRNVGKG